MVGERTGVEVLLSNKGGVVLFFAEAGGTLFEDRGGVGLGDGDDEKEVDYAGEDELEPVEPAPAGSVREVTTNERTWLC